MVGISGSCLNETMNVGAPVQGWMGSGHWVALPRTNMFIFLGYYKKVPQTGCLILSPFWRLKVQNQGVGRVVLSLKDLFQASLPASAILAC